MSDFNGSIFLPDLEPLSPFSYTDHDGDLIDNNLMEDEVNNYHLENPNVEQHVPLAPVSRKRRGRPPSSEQHVPLAPVSRKRRGRPPGSKNKPKPPPVSSELAMDLMTIYIPIGCCIIDWLIRFSLRNNVGLNVMSAIGSVASVALNNPTIPPLDGPFNILSLRGTVVGGGGLTSLLGRTFGAINPSLVGSVTSYSSLGILVEGLQGLVLGGINGGNLVANEPVMVMVSTFTIFAFQRMSNNGGNEYQNFMDHLHNRLGPN